MTQQQHPHATYEDVLETTPLRRTVDGNSAASTTTLPVQQLQRAVGSEVLAAGSAAVVVPGRAAAGQASLGQTVLNMMKTCMGTGTLALAYACQQGGIGLYLVGGLAIAVWNVYVIHLLVECLRYAQLQQSSTCCSIKNNCSVELGTEPDKGPHPFGEEDACDEDAAAAPPTPTTALPAGSISTFGRVAYHAFGPVGVQVLDCVMLILLLGIIIAYVSAVASFIGDTPLSISATIDSILAGIFIASLALVPDLGYLAGASALGLVVLAVAFVIIAGYGLFGETASAENSTIATISKLAVMNQFPLGINGISHWFGVAVFGFGTVPLTYNFQESMKEPERVVSASIFALGGVCAVYTILGVGLYTLFPDLSADVLHELPETGVLPILTRLAMTWTILVTGPLILVPCAELLEGKFDVRHHPNYRVVARFGIAAVSVFVSVLLPGFVAVLSFVGCFCVASVSFIIPPLFHLQLLLKRKTVAGKSPSLPDQRTGIWLRPRIQKLLDTEGALTDVLLLVGGILATIVSTYCTLRG
jgi:solute carrier family 36 (proton-coupled amino acid transporter)